MTLFARLKVPRVSPVSSHPNRYTSSCRVLKGIAIGDKIVVFCRNESESILYDADESELNLLISLEFRKNADDFAGPC